MTRYPASAHVRFWTALYSGLARAMPRNWRDQVGSEAVSDFMEILVEADRRVGRAVFGSAVVGMFDLARRIPLEHWHEFGDRPNREFTTVRPGGLGWGEKMTNGMREVRMAARSLMKRPGFTVVAALTLALGIGANAAIYSVVNAVLLQPLPYQDSDDIVVVQHHAPGIDLPTLSVSTGLMNFYWESADFFQPLGSYSRAQRVLTGDDQAAQIQVLLATPELFDVLRVLPAVGRPFQEADVMEGASPVAILTDATWRARYGSDPSILGRTVVLDGVTTEIVGVMPADFGWTEPYPTMLTPLAIAAEGRFGEFGTQGLARLAPGLSVDAADQRITDLQSRLTERFPDLSQDFLDQAGWSASVERWRDSVVGDIASTLWIVLGTVGLVFLIACANVANLFLVRAEGRQKEMAIRAAMGAGRRSVAATLMAESVLLGVLGGVLGTGIAWLGLAVLVEAGPSQLPRLQEIGLDATTVLLTLLLSVGAGVAFGFLSWVRYAGGGLARVLRDGGRANTVGRERHRTRNFLVASQLALALVLLIGSGLMLRSFARLHAIDPGFEAAGVLTVGMSAGETDDRPGAARFYMSVADEVAALPGVEAVGVTTRVPLSSGNTNGGSFEIESRPTEDDELPPVAMYRAIGPGYFTAMGIELLEGRDIERVDVEEAGAVVWINETFSRTHFPEGALGEAITWDDDGTFARIVGVVEDTKEMSLTEDQGSWAYIPLVAANWGYPGLESAFLTIAVDEARDPSALVPAIRDIVARLDSNVPVTTTSSMEEVLDGSMASTSFAMVLLGIATGVALFLGAIGLFGVISYVVSQRTREIGVRVALGARTGEVSGMVVRQALLVSGMGTAVGLIGAFGLSRVMSALLFEVSTTDPVTFVAAPVLLIAVSLLASWLPARRAARVDPVTALRAE